MAAERRPPRGGAGRILAGTARSSEEGSRRVPTSPLIRPVIDENVEHERSAPRSRPLAARANTGQRTPAWTTPRRGPLISHRTTTRAVAALRCIQQARRSPRGTEYPAPCPNRLSAHFTSLFYATVHRRRSYAHHLRAPLRPRRCVPCPRANDDDPASSPSRPRRPRRQHVRGAVPLGNGSRGTSSRRRWSTGTRGDSLTPLGRGPHGSRRGPRGSSAQPRVVRTLCLCADASTDPRPGRRTSGTVASLPAALPRRRSRAHPRAPGTAGPGDPQPPPAEGPIACHPWRRPRASGRRGRAFSAGAGR